MEQKRFKIDRRLESPVQLGPVGMKVVGGQQCELRGMVMGLRGGIERVCRRLEEVSFRGGTERELDGQVVSVWKKLGVEGDQRDRSGINAEGV